MTREQILVIPYRKRTRFLSG